MSNWDLGNIYAQRRQQLLARMGEGLAWINSSGQSFDSGHCRNVEYLTGVRHPDACLLLSRRGFLAGGVAHCGIWWSTPQGSEYGRGHLVHEALFVPQFHDRYDGTVVTRQMPSLEQYRAMSGMTEVYDLMDMEEVLRQAVMEEDVLWVNTSVTPELGQPVPPDVVRINEIRDRFYWLRLKNIAPIVHDLRRIKDPYELECITKAYQITKDILERCMREVKPGDNEAKVKAIFEYEVHARIKEGEQDLRMGFGPIVSAGARGARNNYWAGNQTIGDGDLILVDCGVSYRGYSADITRAWPVNGKFSKRQREIYDIVLEGQNRGLATMKPGSTPDVARRAVYAYYQQFGLEKYGLGRNNHPVGLNVEDGYYFGFGDFTPYRVNEAWAFEPMLMIHDEGIAIRMEDGLVITEKGYRLLPAPDRNPDVVEAICQGRS